MRTHDAAAGMWASKTQLFTFVEPALAPVVNWFRAIAGQPLEAHITNLELCITFSVVFMMFTAIFNVYNVMVHLIKQHGFVKGVSHIFTSWQRLAPHLFLQLTCAAWFYIPSCRAVVSASPHVFYATAGAIFANYTSKLMVSHVCDLDYKPSHIETAYFLLTPVVMFMLHTGYVSLVVRVRVRV
ncbi:hypothetical protein EON66_09570 [archaeon]|nr:MAG: hypothetical protein EON66_09570 [archaeon]